MKSYKADIHIHTVLSPCGDLDMSPVNIVQKALDENLNIIGITDHNSTLNCNVIEKIASKHNLFVLKGAEVTTKEEVHCLTFFESIETLNLFQQYLTQHLPPIINDTEQFGYQVVVDENDNIIDQVDYLLISAINQSIDQVEKKTHELNGIFIPAHIDKKTTSLISQLGFIPFDLNADAFELSANAHKSPEVIEMARKTKLPLITNSDAHFLNQIGTRYNEFFIDEISFENIKKAIKNNQIKSLLN